LARGPDDPDHGRVRHRHLLEVRGVELQGATGRALDLDLRGDLPCRVLELLVEVVLDPVLGEAADDHREDDEDRHRQPRRNRGEPPSERPALRVPRQSLGAPEHHVRP
jgi:hypothetical protein